MAITKGAKKAIRSQERKRIFNIRTKRTMAHTTKEAEALKGKDRGLILIQDYLVRLLF